MVPWACDWLPDVPVLCSYVTVCLGHVGIYRRGWGLGSGWPEVLVGVSLCEVS